MGMKSSKEKKAEAVERQEFWDNLSLKEKIASLDCRLGVGIGATKQRARIAEQIEKSNG